MACDYVELAPFPLLRARCRMQDGLMFQQVGSSCETSSTEIGPAKSEAVAAPLESQRYGDPVTVRQPSKLPRPWRSLIDGVLAR
jgi:hypothetical protein